MSAPSAPGGARRHSPIHVAQGGRTAAQRGVSLIEALVAIAIMAFGMLGLAGLQSSLRANADISKQRSEAVRMAQETLEQVRSFSSFDATPARWSYTQIQSAAAASAPSDNSNTVYTRTVTVLPVGSANAAVHKQVVVTVSWIDRLNSDPPPSVTLSTIVAGVPPELQASLASPPSGAAAQNPGGRHRSIPRQAKLLDRGISVFKPPQQPGGGTVAWVFDNTTALFKSCTVAADSTTASLTKADLGETCLTAAVNQQLLSGYVRFVAGTASVEQAKLPTGTALNLDLVLTLTSTGHTGDPVCFDDAPSIEAEAGASPGRAVAYYCAIPKRHSGTWKGRSRIRPQGWIEPVTSAWEIHGSTAGAYQVCRYTTMVGNEFETNDGKTNQHHPLDYVDLPTRSVPNEALTQQNFLVMPAPGVCPTEETTGEAVNANTLVHQDGITYSNPN